MCKNEILSMGNKVNSCKGHACKESNERKYTQHTTYTCMKTALSNRIQYTWWKLKEFHLGFNKIRRIGDCDSPRTLGTVWIFSLLTLF